MTSTWYRTHRDLAGFCGSFRDKEGFVSLAPIFVRGDPASVAASTSRNCQDMDLQHFGRMGALDDPNIEQWQEKEQEQQERLSLREAAASGATLQHAFALISGKAPITTNDGLSVSAMERFLSRVQNGSGSWQLKLFGAAARSLAAKVDGGRRQNWPAAEWIEQMWSTYQVSCNMSV